MARYLNNNGKRRSTDLYASENVSWEVAEIDREDLEEAKEEQWIAISPRGMLEDYFEEVHPLYPDEAGWAKYVKLYYVYDEEDILDQNPIADHITYPAFESRGEEILYDEFERIVYLNMREKAYFTQILKSAIGDPHDEATQKIMREFANSIDKEIRYFVQDIEMGREVIPITVGFFNQEQRDRISACLRKGICVESRCTLDSDVVRYIIKKHIEFGKPESGMSDILDIARMSYVIANFDSVKYGETKETKKYLRIDGASAHIIVLKKQIGDKYYIVEMLLDVGRNKNRVVNAYMTI